MDDRSFDRLARLLGGAADRRAGLKALIGAMGILGSGTLAALDDGANAAARRRRTGKDNRDERRDDAAAANRKKRRRACKPACTDGHVCQKAGRKRQCVCPTGVTCGAACCRAGQTCQNGACANAPEPVDCIAFGQPCGEGGSCCDGLTCASGQGGSYPLTCLKADGAACESTADCPYGLSCTDGRCIANPVPEECAPAGASCAGGVTCCAGSTCLDGACVSGGGRGLGAECSTVADCRSVTGVQCVAYASAVPGATSQTYCLLPDGTAATSRTHCVGKALDLDGTCRTCTVYHGTQADDVALAALKTAIESGAANPVYVGTGLYKPLSTMTGTTLITASRGTAAAPLQILACLDADAPARPVIDGGADVKKGADAPAPTDNARDLTWTGGNRIMEIAPGTNGSEKAVEIVGIDFQHGNASGDGGALFVPDYASLTLKSSTITRCRAENNGGGISVYWEYGYEKGGSATLRGVTITQCSVGPFSGFPETTGGAINHSGLALKIEGSSSEKTLLTYNYAPFGGAISTRGSNFTDGSTCDLAWVEITGNVATNRAGGIYCNKIARNGMVLSNVLIESNSVISSNGGGTGGGMYLVNCGHGHQNSGGATYSKNVFTNVTIQGNQAGQAGGIHLSNENSYTLNGVASADAPIEFIDSLVTNNISRRWTGSNNKSNGGYSNQSSTNSVAITCTRTGPGKTFTGNGDPAYDCSGSSPSPLGTDCCATTTACTSTAICGARCCTAATSCTGTSPTFTCNEA